MTTQTIPIELSRPGPLPVVYATAGDVYSRQVTLQLYDGSVPYTPPEGTTCLIGWRRQDGTAGNYDKITEADGESTHPAWQLEGSALTVELSKQLCAAAGDVAMNVALIGSDGSRLHTWELTCRVERGAVEDSDDPSLPSESASAAADRAEQAAQDAQSALQAANNAVNQANDAVTRAEQVVSEAGAVVTVNGKGGNVVLDAADVGALPVPTNASQAQPGMIFSVQGTDAKGNIITKAVDIPVGQGFATIPEGTVLPPSQRQDGTLYGQMIDNFNGTHPVFGGAASEPVTPPVSGAPTAPGSISVSGVTSGSTATIAVTAATDSDGTIASYIYQRSVDGGAWQQIAQSDSLTQTDAVSADWATVTYRAAAVDNNGLQGPYVTSQTETVNTDWVMIGGPMSNLGVRSDPFDIAFTVDVSGHTGVRSTSASVFLDGAQVYGEIDLIQGATVTVSIDTRALASGLHEIQVIAERYSYLSASAAYYFTVPSMGLQNGGSAATFQSSDGNAVYPVTSSRYVIGPGGMSVQTQLQQLANAHKGITGHLSFVDAVIGPEAEYVVQRETSAAYAIQCYAPTSLTGSVMFSVYPGYNGTLENVLTATADSLTFNVPAYGIVSVWKYVKDELPPADTDLSAKFVALDQPRAGLVDYSHLQWTATNLNEALKRILEVPGNYYTIFDAVNPDLIYYVASEYRIDGEVSIGAPCTWVTSANPTQIYNGSISMIDTTYLPSVFYPVQGVTLTNATASNPTTAGSSISNTILQMYIAALETTVSYPYLLQNAAGDQYYVVSPTEITSETTSVSGVYYCVTEGTYYTNETLTLQPNPEVTQ